MTSAIRPIDEAVGLFKVAFRRLLVENVLDGIKTIGQIKQPFMINQAVRTKEAVRFMKRTWDIVPRYVAFNYWLQTVVKGQFQLYEISEKKYVSVCLSFRAFKVSFLESEKV